MRATLQFLKPCHACAGRRHQLRRHLALLGHPVLGDPQYSYGYAKQVAQAARPTDGYSGSSPDDHALAHGASACATPRAMAVARLGPQVSAMRWDPSQGRDAELGAAEATLASPACALLSGSAGASEDGGSAVLARRRCGQELRGAADDSEGISGHAVDSSEGSESSGSDVDSFSASTAVERLRNDRPALRGPGSGWHQAGDDSAQRSGPDAATAQPVARDEPEGVQPLGLGQGLATLSLHPSRSEPGSAAGAGAADGAASELLRSHSALPAEVPSPAMRRAVSCGDPAARDGAASKPSCGAGEQAARPDMCLWAVGLAFTHPFTGAHVSLAIPEPAAFAAARARELAAWRAKTEA